MVSPPYRCRYWPKGCKVTSKRWVLIKAHEKNCPYR